MRSAAAIVFLGDLVGWFIVFLSRWDVATEAGPGISESEYSCSCRISLGDLLSGLESRVLRYLSMESRMQVLLKIVFCGH